MTDLRKAAEMALEALEIHVPHVYKDRGFEPIQALRQALAQPEQEPVACIGTNGELMWLKKPSAVYSHAQPLYTAPPALAQPEQEPVAWIHNMIEGGFTTKPPVDLTRHPERWTALYSEPKPCLTCEALARTVMMDQTSHDTAPPKREWVGLTDEEMEDLWDRYAHMEMMRAIEAKLKEKNNG